MDIEWFTQEFLINPFPLSRVDVRKVLNYQFTYNSL